MQIYNIKQPHTKTIHYSKSPNGHLLVYTAKFNSPGIPVEITALVLCHKAIVGFNDATQRL